MPDVGLEKVEAAIDTRYQAQGIAPRLSQKRVRSFSLGQSWRRKRSFRRQG